MKTFIFLCSIAFGVYIHSGDAIYCAYYPAVNQNDPMNPSQDEVMGVIQPDNVTIYCPEENDRCYSFWYTHPNYENEILIQKQGCWGNEAKSLNCNQENCTAHSKPSEYLVRTKNQTSRICCCAGDYCNRNVSDAYVALPSTKPTVTQYKVISDQMNHEMERTILIAVIPIFCVSVAIAIMYFIFRMRLRSTKAQMSQLPMIEAPPPEPTFDLDQLKMMELVGQGRYCNVYRAALSENEVAVKVFTGSSKQCYMNELDIMGLPHMEHSNLLQYVGSGDRMGEDGWVEHLLVVDMISKGSLMSYLRENTYDWHTMCRLAQTTAAGLAHLHQVVDTQAGLKPAVVHRDINSRNVLVNEEGNCVIGDFGFAMQVCGSSVVGEGDGDNSTITDETPRKRSKDYQRVEIEALLQFVATRKHELFGTGGKGSSKEEKMKERTWKRATQSLRAAGGQEREWQTLRKKWRDMASKAKAYKAPRTGGGPPPEHNEIHERVLAILAREIVDGILPEEDEQNSQDSQATDLSGYQPPEPKHPQPQPPEPQPNQHQPHQPQPDMLAQRPAQIRQLEIQEELLRIQRDKLKVKQKQVNISEAILEELRSIKNMLAIKPTAIDLLNSTQQGRY